MYETGREGRHLGYLIRQPLVSYLAIRSACPGPRLYGSPLHRVAYRDALSYYRACTALRLVQESIGFACNAIFILPRAPMGPLRSQGYGLGQWVFRHTRGAKKG